MTTTPVDRKPRIRVCTVDELQSTGTKLVSAEGRTVLIIADQGNVYALDNRCPHMGFPLQRGTIRDGILTCHWHHAKFDLGSGCTFDPFADDVPSFYVEVRNGEVWLDPDPIEEPPREHWLAKLDDGLEQNIRLILAKSVIGLDSLGATKEILRRGSLFGINNRAAGWSTGLSILTAMANVLPYLFEEDRPLALYQGLAHVARSTAGQPPDFNLEPLRTSETRPERYIAWFRQFIEVRAADAAERTLRTAIRIGISPKSVADMVFAASTDHLYMDVGHSLDFANKAFELLDHIGWEHAEEVLPSLIPGLVSASRMEESSSWRHPLDLAQLLGELYEEMDTLIERGAAHPKEWDGHEELARTIIDGEPPESLGMMRDLVDRGVPLEELSAAVAYAASLRPVHFRVSNEFADWDTVHHVFTYTNAVDQAMRRAPSALLARGIFDGAMAVYLERFLNIPKQPIPPPSGRESSAEDLLASFDAQGQVDATAQVVVDLMAQGRHQETIRALGHALLREDSGFHQFQIYEAALRQYHRFAGTPAGDNVLIGATRFLSAHSPTVRAVRQTYEIAARLHRGEALHDEVT